MSNVQVQVHPQFESRYNALGDLSNPDGWPRRANVYESSFRRTNPEPVYTAGATVFGTRSMPQYITRNSIYVMRSRRYMTYCRY